MEEVSEVKNMYKTFVGNTEGVRPVGGPRPRSGNNIKLIFTLRLLFYFIYFIS